MAKAYVLMELGWEYNDENYYRPESGGGVPRKVYMDAAKALKACNKLNDSEWTEECPQYCEVVEVEVEA